MGPLHVLVDLRDRDDEVDVEVVDDVDDETEGHDKARVLEVRQLNVHGPELYSPPDIRIMRWWWLETKGVPIGRLQIFKMTGEVLVIYLILDELALVGRDRIPSEQSGHMVCQPIIDVNLFLKKILVLFVEPYGWRIIVSVGDVIMI